MSNSSKFWDKIANKYSKQPIGDQASYERKLEVTRGYFHPEMELLEIGCGTGGTAILHAPHVKHIRAIDISANMLTIAREKARAAGTENVTFENLTIDELDMPDESLDMVLGLSILHLLEDKDAAIAKVNRMLKPGGLFVTSTVCLGDHMSWFKYIAPIGKFFGFFPLVTVLKAEDLEASFKAAGFDIDHRWRPDKGKALFLVGKKAG